LDLGCGGGAATYEISKNFPTAHFHGVDRDPHLIDEAKTRSNILQATNLTFGVDDIYHLKQPNHEAVISLQTLSWLPDYEEPMTEIALKICPKWIALTSLFYEGEITAITTIHEHLRNRSVNYNTYSLPRFSRFCESLGYKLAIAQPFILPFDLDRPSDAHSMGTYTITEGKRFQRIQISGPLIMNWMTLILQKS
jgi:2-polyprenyl-3-methyl-5-hydroxy-6-metoxy-1,4-benzoquinol methylase